MVSLQVNVPQEIVSKVADLERSRPGSYVAFYEGGALLVQDTTVVNVIHDSRGDLVVETLDESLGGWVKQ